MGNYFEWYVIIGIAYSWHLWSESPEEEKVIHNLADLGNVACQAIGIALLWPLIAYINHLWKGPKDG